MNATKKLTNELRKQFAHVTDAHIICTVREYKTMRGVIARLEKDNKTEEEKHNRPDVGSITLATEWVRNYYWGNNPHTTATVYYTNGTCETIHGSAGGCGYDKYSAALAECLNVACSGMLWRARNKRSKKPYGLSHYEKRHMFFEGGTGADCMVAGCKYLGAKHVTHDRSAKSYDYLHIQF